MNRIRLSALSALLLFGFGSLKAQNAAVSTGGEATGSGGSISYSVGQVVYTSNSGSTGSIAQGIQQAYEIYTTSSDEITGINLVLRAFPNPTANVVTLQIEEYDSQPLEYQLFDLQGHLLATSIVSSNTTTIHMEHLSSATYYLRISAAQALVKTFKIVKN